MNGDGMRGFVGNMDSCMPPLWLIPCRYEAVIGIGLVLLERLT